MEVGEVLQQQAPELVKAIIFGQTLNFSGKSQQLKMKKYFVFIKRKNGIYSVCLK